MAKGPSQADIDRLTLATKYRLPGGPLPPGLHADSAYQAFLRGMGMDYNTAQSVALQTIAATRAQYATAVQRDPAVYHQARDTVNGELGDRGLWFSGERVTKLNDERVKDQQRLQDFASAKAQGIATAEQQLQQQVSQLARQRAEQVGQLQGRTSAISNQDRYIAALRSANAAAAGGGGGGGFSMSAAPGAPNGAPGAPGSNVAGPPRPDPNAFPEYREGTSRMAYFNGLTQPQQMQFAAFLHGVTPNSPDPLTTLNSWLGVQQGVQGHPVNAGAGRGNF